MQIKNEAAAIVEWLEYHHSLMGIAHFYIYDNNSTDGVRKVSFSKLELLLGHRPSVMSVC